MAWVNYNTPVQANPDKSAWDTRQHYSKEIVYRINLFNNTKIDKSGSSLSSRWEALRDLFLTASAYFPKEQFDIIWCKVYNEIHSLIYPKRTGEKEMIRKRKLADIMIDETFCLVMKNIKEAGLLMPEKDVPLNDEDEFEKSY